MLFVRGLLKLFPDPDVTGAGGGDPKPEEKKEKKSEQSNVELAKALKEARENSVPKADYEKLEKINLLLACPPFHVGNRRRL